MKNANGKWYKETTSIAAVRDFVNSGETFRIIEEFTQKNEYICAQCLRQAVNACGYKHITVSVRKGKVWLINELKIAK